MYGLKMKTKIDELKYNKEDISPCSKCNCMTKSIRLGRAKYECGKCGADKSLSDVFFYQATHKKEEEDRRKFKGGKSI